MKQHILKFVILLCSILVGSCGSNVIWNPPPTPDPNYKNAKYVFLRKGTLVTDSSCYYRANDSLDGYFYLRTRQIVINMDGKNVTKVIQLDTFNTHAREYFEGKDGDDEMRDIIANYDINKVLGGFK